MPPEDDVTYLMGELRRGNAGAAGRLVERFYPELKRLLASRATAPASRPERAPPAPARDARVQCAAAA
jgi:hypothetical protein